MAKYNFTPKEIAKAVSASWSKQTCWPGAWNPKVPAAGQCRVTSAVVYKLLGGEIMRAEIKKNPLYTHFWNVLPNGKKLDLTSKQFTGFEKIPQGKPMRFSEVIGIDPIKFQYKSLFKKVRAYLQNQIKK